MRRVIVLGTGGTIAGRAAAGADNIGYTAGAGRRGRTAGRHRRAGRHRARGRAGGADRQQGHGASPSGARWPLRCAHWLAAGRRGGHRDHARHRHAGGNRVLPAVGAGAGQAGGADLRDAAGDGARARRAAERARCDRGRGRRRARRASWWSAPGAVHSALDVQKVPHLPARCLRLRATPARWATWRRAPCVCCGTGRQRRAGRPRALRADGDAPRAGRAWRS